MCRKVYPKAVTLLELILAVVLLSMISLGFLSIDIFSRNSVLSADRQAKVQNSVAFALAHMNKNIGNAIGDESNPPVTFPTNVTVGGETYPAILVRVDSNNNGLRDIPTDQQITYYYNNTSYTLSYCGDYPVCSSVETLSNKVVSNLSSTYVNASDFSTCCDACAVKCTNYVKIQLTGRWDPDGSASPQNPEVKLYSDIKMPLVSVN